MLSKHKQPSLEGGLLIILVVIAIFSIGYYTEGNITGMFVKENKEESLEKVTGNMVKVKNG